MGRIEPAQPACPGACLSHPKGTASSYVWLRVRAQGNHPHLPEDTEKPPLHHGMTLVCSSQGWGVWPACYRFNLTYMSHLALQWPGACRSELTPWEFFSWIFGNRCRPQSKYIIHCLQDSPLTKHCTGCNYKCLSILCLECAPVSMTQDP